MQCHRDRWGVVGMEVRQQVYLRPDIMESSGTWIGPQKLTHPEVRYQSLFKHPYKEVISQGKAGSSGPGASTAWKAILRPEQAAAVSL